MSGTPGSVFDDLHLFLFYYSRPIGSPTDGTVCRVLLVRITWRIAPIARGWNRVV
jgi:hypothetical protein